MRVTGSTISLTLHVAAAAAVLLGPATAGPREPAKPVERPIILQPAVHPRDGGPGIPIPGVGEGFRIPEIPGPTIPASIVGPIRSTVPTVGAPTLVGSAGPSSAALFSDETPVVLSGPLPRYPELLRQAGIQGRVLLEAIVDTTGRVDAASIHVVYATNPAFIEGARDAIRASLFRPGRVGGRVVRVRVRIPFEFTLRNGGGFAR